MNETIPYGIHVISYSDAPARLVCKLGDKKVCFKVGKNANKDTVVGLFDKCHGKDDHPMVELVFTKEEDFDAVQRIVNKAREEWLANQGENSEY